MRVIVSLTAFVLATFAWAEPTTCRQGDLVRTVEVVYAEPGKSVPCEVLYDKPAEGGTTTPWSQSMRTKSSSSPSYHSRE